MIISRPQPARWFQLLTARDDLPATMDLLAREQVVELESDANDTQPTLTPEIAQRLERFHLLTEPLRPYLPTLELHAPRTFLHHDPVRVLDFALDKLTRWQSLAQPVIVRIQELKGQLAELESLEEMALSAGTLALDLRRLSAPDQVVGGALFLLPISAKGPSGSALTLTFASQKWRFMVAMDRREALTALEADVTAVKGRRLVIPDWFGPTCKVALKAIHDRKAEGHKELLRVVEQLAQVSREAGLAEPLVEVARLTWFFNAVEQVVSRDRLAWITGWTSMGQAEGINRALQENGNRALFTLADKEDANPPLVLVNPSWVKPFELFAKLIGLPGRFEADPSPLLVVLAPLLFGYMFGDVGQGIVLALGGLFLARQRPEGWLLVAGGVSATLFGFLFGSVFCLEHLIPALWLHPIGNPLLVLGLPIGLGVGIIVGGFALNSLESLWRGDISHWLRAEGGVVLIYLGVLTWLLHPAGLWLLLLGVGWHLLGNIQVAKQPLDLLKAFGHLPETLMQLGVNTLSFSRVGAFALAHAGLAQAVVSLAGLAGDGVGALLVLILGNVVIILLEGLVVSIQTTRLILFEFFIRFLHGGGRPFRPLAPPSERVLVKE